MGQVDARNAFIVRGQGNRNVIFQVRPDGMPVARYAQDGFAAGQVDLDQDALFGHPLHELRCLRVVKYIGAVTDAPGAGNFQRGPDMPTQVFGGHQAHLHFTGMQGDTVFCRGKVFCQAADHFHLPAVVSQGDRVIFRRDEVQPHVARVFLDEVVGQQGLGQYLFRWKYAYHLGQVTHGHVTTGIRLLLSTGERSAPLLFYGVQLEDCCRSQFFDLRVAGQLHQRRCDVELLVGYSQLPRLCHAPGLQQFQVKDILARRPGASFGQHLAFMADACGDKAPERREKLVVPGYRSAFVVAYGKRIDNPVYHVGVIADSADRWPAALRVAARRRDHVGFQVDALAVLRGPADVAFCIDGAVQVIVQFASLGESVEEIPQQGRFKTYLLKIRPGFRFTGYGDAASGNGDPDQY